MATPREAAWPPGAAGASTRWELYRLLADPVRPRLLALVAAEELTIGELAELLREGQPKVSRHATALREAGLVTGRKHGTYNFVRLAPGAAADPVVADALGAGNASCQADGTLDRIDEVVASREDLSREFFSRLGRPQPARVGPPLELGSYLAAFAPLLGRRHLAVDVGTGEGPLLEVLAPLFERVVAIDRSAAQLAIAAERVRRRGLENVVLVHGAFDGEQAREAIAGNGASADVVFASRILHHAPAPGRAVRTLVDFAARGGAVCILDYLAHEDETMREQQADLWLGFEPEELQRLAAEAGLTEVTWRRLPTPWQGDGPDAHLAWQLLVGFRA